MFHKLVSCISLSIELIFYFDFLESTLKEEKNFGDIRFAEKNHDWPSYLTNMVVRTSITVRLTETWIQCCFNFHLRNGIIASHEL